MEAKLEVLVGTAKGREIPLPSSQFIIGRGGSCHLRPHSELVSKLHCAIGRQSGHVYVRDLKSSNKTYVNDEEVKGGRRVQNGDVLRVGPLQFRFLITETPDVLPQSLRKENVSWLMNDEGDSFEYDSSAETTVIDIPKELLEDDGVNVDAEDEAGNKENTPTKTNNENISAGKYLHQYFNPKKSEPPPEP